MLKFILRIFLAVIMLIIPFVWLVTEFFIGHPSFLAAPSFQKLCLPIIAFLFLIFSVAFVFLNQKEGESLLPKDPKLLRAKIKNSFVIGGGILLFVSMYPYRIIPTVAYYLIQNQHEIRTVITKIERGDKYFCRSGTALSVSYNDSLFTNGVCTTNEYAMNISLGDEISIEGKGDPSFGIYVEEFRVYTRNQQ